MLVLQRRENETIVLDVPGCEAIEITVVKIKGTKSVRLGVAAPTGVTIIRGELKERWYHDSERGR